MASTSIVENTYFYLLLKIAPSGVREDDAIHTSLVGRIFVGETEQRLSVP